MPDLKVLRPDKTLMRMYARYNKLYWDGRLPEAIVGWDGDISSDAWALTHCYDLDDTKRVHASIALHPGLKVYVKYKHLVFLHEMAHIAVHPYPNHGKKFQEEMLRIATRGAFRDVW